MEGAEDKPADGEKRNMDTEPVSGLEEMLWLFKIIRSSEGFAYTCKTKRKQLPYLRRNMY